MNSISAIPTSCQKSIDWEIDVFPLDIGASVNFKTNSGFNIGLEGELGVNFSNYILLSGSHFSNKLTLIPYQSRDSYGNEKYYGLFGLGVFTRVRSEEKIPLDIGIRTELFLHVDDSDDDVGSGFYSAAYVKAFKTIKYKIRDNRKLRKMSIGVRMSAGILSEYSLKEFGVLTDFWLRFHL